MNSAALTARERLERARSGAGRAAAEGQYAEAVELLRAALADAALQPGERVVGLSSLASALRLDRRWMEAEQVARDAVALATALSEPRALARAKLEHGTLLLTAFEAAAPVREEIPLEAALESLDGAAEIYESLGSIDFYPCLLAIGRILSISEEDPSALYARITTDLVEERWERACRESGELARHVDYLRGRAFFELGSAQADSGNVGDAAEHLEAARGLLAASQAPEAAAVLERIDELLA